MRNLDDLVDCGVVDDLLPSYLEGICTASSRRLVEAHLEDCAACAEKARRLRETVLSGQGLEGRALDAARKIRRRILLQGTAGFFLVGFQCLLGLQLLLAEPWGLDPAHFLWFAAVLAACALLSAGQKNPMEKADRRLLLPVGLLAVLSAGLPAVNGALPLSGTPLMETVLVLSAGLYLVQLALFAAGLYRTFRRSVRNAPLLAAGQTGMFLCLHWGPLLRYMPQLRGSWGLSDAMVLLWMGAAALWFARPLPRLFQGRRDRLSRLAGVLVLAQAMGGVYILTRGSSRGWTTYRLWPAAALLCLILLARRRPPAGGPDRTEGRALIRSLLLALLGAGLMVWAYTALLLRTAETEAGLVYRSFLFGDIPWGDFPAGLVLEGLYTLLFLMQLTLLAGGLLRLLEKRADALPGMASALAGMFSLLAYSEVMHSLNLDAPVDMIPGLLLRETAVLFVLALAALVLAELAARRRRTRES